MEFKEFDKIARWSRDIVITEKIDGTNAQVFIRELPDNEEMPTDSPIIAVVGKLLLYAGSRSRWISVADDNFGFAAFVAGNAEELAKLGAGQHFGEWWGAGIQRKYGLSTKRFSLFNTSRWSDEATRPSCCHVVPVLYHGDNNASAISTCVEDLRAGGSIAAPGFMKPEGIVIWHEAARQLFKKTLEKDEKPKGKAG